MARRGVAVAALLSGILWAMPASAQTGTTPESLPESSASEVAPAVAGEWIAIQTKGCKLWNEHPHWGETVTWSGVCVHGLATGSGTTQWFLDGKPGEKSIANYVDGKLNGKGVVTYTNGNHYEGDFVENKRTGKGVFTWANGNRYEG